MGMIGGTLGYRILRRIAVPRPSTLPGRPGHYDAHALVTAYGRDMRPLVQGRTVIDFGCGYGEDAVHLAQLGASRVIGIDIREDVLQGARELAHASGVADRCLFTTTAPERGDVVLSKDAFEHFDDPALALRQMAVLVKQDGRLLVSFGPTWLHPAGGHLFSVFPWAHLIFSERALLRWRADFRDDGATRFSEVAGGLNQMTIARFERLVEDSPLKLDWLETVPIRGVTLLKQRWCREFGSSLVRCGLSLR